MSESSYKFGNNKKVNADVHNAASAVGLNKDGEDYLRRSMEIEKGAQGPSKRKDWEYSDIYELAKDIWNTHSKFRK